MKHSLDVRSYFDLKLSPSLVKSLKSKAALAGGEALGDHIDVGCGLGGLIRAFQRHGLFRRSIGYDSDCEVLEEARILTASHQGKVEFRCEAVENLMLDPNNSGRASLITAIYVAHHFGDFVGFLGSAIQVLERDGILYISDCYAPDSHKSGSVARYIWRQLFCVDRRALRDLPIVAWEVGVLRVVLMWLRRVRYFVSKYNREHVANDLKHGLPHSAERVEALFDQALGSGGYSLIYLFGYTYVLTLRR